MKLDHPLFVIIGPSGSGKTRVTEAVFPKAAKVITHTTRKMRIGESEGIDYFFETKESFKKLIEEQTLVEYDCYHDQYYGISKKDIQEITDRGYAYVVLTFPGYQRVKELFSEQVIGLFFTITKENVAHRLRQREQDESLIAERMYLYQQEMEQLPVFLTYSNTYRINADQPFSQVVTAVEKVVKQYT